MEALQSINTKSLKQIDTLIKENSELKKTIQLNETQIQSLEARGVILESETEMKNQEIERMEAKLIEYEEIIENLRQSLEAFIKGKDDEIERIKNVLGALEEKLLQTTTDYEDLLSQNQELNQTLDNILSLNADNRIRQLEEELEKSEKARHSLQSQLKKTEAQIESHILVNRNHDVSIEVYILLTSILMFKLDQ